MEASIVGKLQLIMPLDQPLGRRRLLTELKNALRDDQFTAFRLIVAYAKSGPFHRLRESLEAWRGARKTTEAIFGIDQQGSSREALELALMLFDRVYVTREPGLTFHPKIYLFTSKTSARAFIGSNNLTVGGTETNFEATVQLDLELPTDKATLTTLDDAWVHLLPTNCPATTILDATLLESLVANGDVIDEQTMRRGDNGFAGQGAARSPRPPRSGLKVKPPSPLPKKSLAPTGRQASAANSPKGAGPAIPRTSARAMACGFAIQIKPHHNGEIFLSVSAALQNPEFFRWPFNGATTPKKPGNPSYPQLDPDPVVNIVVYGAPTKPLLTLSLYQLNTVYYEKKSEIRITAAPLVEVVPEYSVMIMQTSNTPGIDYEITIHTPASPEYNAWVTECNQTMPSGGSNSRKFGWF
jgi:hypothetical protein